MQLGLFNGDILTGKARKNGIANKLDVHDKRIHDWYRFVLSFPPHLVREYFHKFGLKSGDTILDPFCGTGTTLVEAKFNGIVSVGIEANPMAHFASVVKTDWNIDREELCKKTNIIAGEADRRIKKEVSLPLKTLPDDAMALLLKDSISPLPLHKSLILLEEINKKADAKYRNHLLLALAKSLVFYISNLHFGPEVGVQRKKKSDAPVVDSWLAEVELMAADLRNIEFKDVPSTIHNADSRDLKSILPGVKIDAVFTSPPYPNEKDYTRTTRLESVMLGFIRNRNELRVLKQGLLRSNTRNVYKDDDDDALVADHPEIQALADEIEKRRIAQGKTSGFERQYARVTKLYFGGMARHLSELRPFLKPGAHLGYVVGDQASYLQVMIRTGKLLAEIAASLGYKVVGIDLFRTRLATATKKQMREEVVVLQWPGIS